MNATVLRPEVALFCLRALLIGGYASAAFAAGLDPAKIPVTDWAYVGIAALVGYLSSSAEMLFGWAENRGWRAFGKIVQGFAASMGAGFGSYLGALAGGVPGVWALLLALGAAYAGENYMRKLGDRSSDAVGPVSKDAP